MSKKAAAAPAAPAINPDGRYEVKLTRAVKVGGSWLRPYNRNVVSGATLEILGDAVESFVEVVK